MKLRLPFFRTKATVAPMSSVTTGAALMPGPGSLFGFIRESFTGAWQRNVVVEADRNLLAFSAVYACVTLIANDIGKLRMMLVQKDAKGILTEVDSDSPFLQVLRKPNHFQNRIQFLVQWVVSKLLHGNTFVLKERDNRGVVTGLYVLDPRLVTPLITDDGGVYYALNSDPLSFIREPRQAAPSKEIIHDRMCTLWHPLVGVSPIYSCGASATQGIRIQANSAAFFENMSRPGGVLTAPGHIPDDTAGRLKAAFEENFTGSRLGRVAVLGDGLKYEGMVIPAADAQLIEQLKWTVEDVARCFHVPLHMIGNGNPTFQNISSLTQAYYSQTLHKLIEDLELCLTEGLELPAKYKVELDTETGLLRMDTAGRYESYGKAIQAGWMSPNEARSRENLPDVKGGQTPYLQQQNWSLEQLDKRDINATTAPAAAAPAAPAVGSEEEDDEGTPTPPAAGAGEGDAPPAAPAADEERAVMEFAVKLIAAFSSEAKHAEP